MTINYPTSLDSLVNPAATDNEDQVNVYHDVQHSDANDAIEALEAKVGITDSTVSTSLDYRIRNIEYYPSATGGEDDDFNDSSFSGWTAVEDLTLTVTESRGRASIVLPSGGTGAHFQARVKAHTFSTNDWCETAVRHFARASNYSMVGLTMTNGTTHGTSNGFHWLAYPTSGGLRWQGNNGMTGDTNRQDYTITSAAHAYADIFLRLRYEGSNTFRGYASPDGISWLDITGAVSSYTLTPTHWGLVVGYGGLTYPLVASYAYFRTGNG